MMDVQELFMISPQAHSAGDNELEDAGDGELEDGDGKLTAEIERVCTTEIQRASKHCRIEQEPKPSTRVGVRT